MGAQITLSQILKETGLPRSLFEEAIKRGELDYYQPGKTRYFDKAKVEEWWSGFKRTKKLLRSKDYLKEK